MYNRSIYVALIYNYLYRIKLLKGGGHKIIHILVNPGTDDKRYFVRQNNNFVPGWARNTNLSVNSRTRYPIAPQRQMLANNHIGLSDLM